MVDMSRRKTQHAARGTQHVTVRVTPRSGRDALAGWVNGVLRVRLAAPPVDGRANAALVRFLAKVTGVPPSSVRIIGGETSREKRVAFENIDAETLSARLGASNEAE
jgi:uncharacterized protein (TIGR00251 family)